jgi:peroxiredoxin Q/BCP
MLQTGDVVPDFSVESDSAGTIDSQALRGQRYVIYFYPKDDTPGCTKEACSFRDCMPDFKDLGVPVFGASADDAKAHGKFAGKYQLNFPLLIDPEKKLLEAFGVWAEKSMYGRTYMGVLRATFVVGADGKVEHLWPKVKPEGHAAEVLAWLKG